MPDVLIVLIIVLVVVFMLRGPKTLPKWGEALGRGFRDAKDGAAKAQSEIQARTSSETKPTDSSDDRPT